jgi:hypothetical protein
MDVKNLKNISANQNFCQMFVISKKNARTLGKKFIGQPMDLEIDGKSIA